MISLATNFVNKICLSDISSHYFIDGVRHGLNVMKHMQHVIDENVIYYLDEESKTDLRLACLLHVVYKPKYYNNIVVFLQSNIQHTSYIRIPRIMEWMSYIHGNNIPSIAIDNPWVLWVRYCDRLDSVDYDNICRTIEYFTILKVPPWVSTTPKLVSREQVIRHATLTNRKNIISIIDYIYDTMICMCNIKCHSPYIDDRLSQGLNILVGICINYGKYDQLIIPPRPTSQPID